MKGKLMLAVLAFSLTIGIVSGCTSQEKEVTTDVDEKPKIAQESTMKTVQQEQLVLQTGYFNGFSDNNLVEFRVFNDEKQSLRVFEVGKEVSSFLSEEKADGNTEFALTYKESKEGITNPTLFKVEKK